MLRLSPSPWLTETFWNTNGATQLEPTPLSNFRIAQLMPAEKKQLSIASLRAFGNRHCSWTVQSRFSFLFHSTQAAVLQSDSVLSPGWIIICIQEAVGGVLKGSVRKCQELQGSAVIHRVQLHPGALLLYLVLSWGTASLLYLLCSLINVQLKRSSVWVGKSVAWSPFSFSFSLLIEQFLSVSCRTHPPKYPFITYDLIHIQGDVWCTSDNDD